MTELLTPVEHDAVAMAGELWNLLTGIVGDGPAREGDLRELIGHIHAIQQAVLKQAAARAYPDQYRLLGGHPAGSRESTAQIRMGLATCPVCAEAVETADVRRLCDAEFVPVSTHVCTEPHR